MNKSAFAFLWVFCAIPFATFGNGFVPDYPIPFPTVPAPTQKPNSEQNTSLMTASSFPKTFQDIGFADRIEIKRAAYEPFQDMEAYKGLVVVGEEHYTERELAQLEMQRREDELKLTKEEYCEKYPTDTDNCKTNDDTLTKVIAIGDAEPPYDSPTTVPHVSPTQPSSPTSRTSKPFYGTTIGGGAVTTNNYVHGGSCYPAAKSKVFKNQVMTTGQYDNSIPPFEKAMITVFRKEGKCGEIKGDPCGYTCYGIGSKCMNIDVRKLTRADAEKIYHDRFWAKYHIDKLPDVIAGDVFLASMASGACTAIQQFRGFLGLNKNCKIDDEVVHAVENYHGDIHNDWLDVRQKFLIEVAKRKYANSVLKGYMNAIRLKRENGCHVMPADPLYR